MDLNREQSFEISLSPLVILKGSEVNAIDGNLDSMTSSADVVFVPVMDLHKASEIFRGVEWEGVPFSVRRNFSESAAFRDESAPMFVVDATEPKLTAIEIGLISSGVIVVSFLRANLDPGIGGGSGDSIVEFEIKIGHFVFKKEKFVLR